MTKKFSVIIIIIILSSFFKCLFSSLSFFLLFSSRFFTIFLSVEGETCYVWSSLVYFFQSPPLEQKKTIFVKAYTAAQLDVLCCTFRTR